jgi:photosystem II stability/assembly factor-like uncharacterized protein
MAGASSRGPRLPNLLVGTVFVAALVHAPGARAIEPSPPSPPPIQAFVDVAVDPYDPAHLFVIHATGNVYATTDRGATWALRMPLSSGPVAIRFDPNHRGHVYASFPQGKYCYPPGIVRSTDGGDSWRAWGRPPCYVVDLIFGGDGAIFARTEYTSTFSAFSALYRTSDDGETWTILPDEKSPVMLRDVALGPVAGQIYVRASGLGGMVVGRSTDNGTSWTTLATTADWISSIAVDPRDPVTLFAPHSTYPPTTVGLLRSKDGGSTWAEATTGLATQPQEVVVDGRSGTAYATDGARLYRTRDRGDRWTQLDVPFTRLSKLTVDPSSPTLWAATGNGLFTSADEGDSWTQLIVSGDHEVRAFLPAIVGGRGEALYQTELTLAHSGPAAATVDLTYVSAAAGRTIVSEPIPAGHQIVIPDALAWLRQRGVPIPTAPAGVEAGTLAVRFRSSEVMPAVHAGARVLSITDAGNGGVAFGSTDFPASESALTVYGLRETPAERSHLAIANPGDIAVTVRVILLGPFALGEFTLAPGQRVQLGSVLAPYGRPEGDARITRTSDAGSFTAYGVINDNVTGDGTLLPAVPVEAAAAQVTVPIILETDRFTSELAAVVPNGCSAIYTESIGSGRGTSYAAMLPEGTWALSPALAGLRALGMPLDPPGPPQGGSVRIARPVYGSGPRPLVALSRTFAPAPGGGRYGVSAPGVPEDRLATSQAWVFGLQETAATRSNLALVNAGALPITLSVLLFDGDTGEIVSNPAPIELEPREWRQIDRPLLDARRLVQDGYVRVTSSSANGAFVVYGVLNDNGTGDGSYLGMTSAR